VTKTRTVLITTLKSFIGPAFGQSRSPFKVPPKVFPWVILNYPFWHITTNFGRGQTSDDTAKRGCVFKTLRFHLNLRTGPIS